MKPEELAQALKMALNPDKKVVVAEVERSGDKLLVPNGMLLEDAVSLLKRKIADEELFISFHEHIDAFPWEGAIAFSQALEEMFGASLQEATQTFFGSNPPSLITIKTGVDTKVSVPWGKFTFPLDKEAELYSTTDEVRGREVFAVSGSLRKKWIPTMHQLLERTKQIIAERSIYRSKAIRLSFTDGDGDVVGMPEVDFVDLRHVNLDEMVYTKELTDLIEANIFTPLKHAAACRAAGIPLKRGVLAAGPYGTGKSLLARAVAKIGTDNGWTFIYIKDASELPHALQFARNYQPAVIFAEDVDRHVTGERSAEMDTILNTLDGIDSKHSEVMVVLTTNHLDQINQAMLRPGRLDVILNVVPPDAEAVSRLVRVYSRGRLSTDTDLTNVGEMLAGYTPAIIREVVERAKLVSITRTGRADATLLAEDVEISAKTMVQQQQLLKKPVPAPDSWHDGLVAAIARETHTALKSNGLGTMESDLKRIKQRFGI